MPLVALGLNHKTAPIALREQVVFSDAVVPRSLAELIEACDVAEAAILSTCNRMELYLSANDPEQVRGWIGAHHDLDTQVLQSHFYDHMDANAVKHLLRVASGLDSMVVGEPQIFGQLKDAYDLAYNAGTIGKSLQHLFQYTFATTKSVRTQTSLGQHPVSIAFAAVTLAKRIFADIKSMRVLLIGAGETIELVAKHLKSLDVNDLIFVNRHRDKAQVLADRYQGEAKVIADIPESLAKVDAVFTATASTLPLIGKGMVERALLARKYKPFYMVDLAVPRDIEPEVAHMRDVYLYNIDDLQNIIEVNYKQRHQAATEAESLIEKHTEHYMGLLRQQDAVKTICSYRDMVEHEREQAIKQALKSLQKGESPEEVVREVARSLTNRLMHKPSVKMRQAAYEGESGVLKVIHELFDL